MVGPSLDLNSARGNHISGNPPATAAEARIVQASNPSILIISNQLNLVTPEESTVESSSTPSISLHWDRTEGDQARMQLATSTGVAPETPMLSKSANRRRMKGLRNRMSDPVSSQSTYDCNEAMEAPPAITSPLALCNEASTSRPVQDVLCPTEQAPAVSKLSKTARSQKNKRLKRLGSGPASVLSADKKAGNMVDDGSSFSVVSVPKLSI